MAAVWQLEPGAVPFEEALSSAIGAQLARVREHPDQFLVLAELNVIARTDPDLLALSQRDQRNNVALVAGHLSRWLTNHRTDQLNAWAAVILAGIDGLTETWLTTRDNDATSGATELFAQAISAALSSNSER